MSDARRHRIADGIAAASAGLLLLLLLLRVLRYAVADLPEGLDAVLGDALIAAWLLFVLPLLIATWHLAALAALVVLLVLRPRVGLERGDGRLRLRPWLHALIWAELAWNHALLDLNPFLAALTVAGLALLALDRVYAASALPVFAGVLAMLLIQLRAPTWADAVAGLVLTAATAFALRGAKRIAGRRERRLGLIAVGVACQLLAAFVPLLLPLHGGTRLGPGLAYSFCEAESAGKLFAAVPAAPTMLPWSIGRRHGERGYVAAYDLDTLAETARHRFFSDDFHGRLEWLTCADGRVYAGMTNTTWRGEIHQDHAMAFDVADPTRFDPDVMPGLDVGHGIALDPRRGALYFVSENRPTLARLDPDSGRREVVLDDLAGRPALSLVVGQNAYHPERDSLFLTEWFFGSDAYELDLVREIRRQRFPHRNGGALGVTVDADTGRLYVVGVWGMEVFDVRTGEVVTRRRLGLLPRSPVIDPVAGRVYVASTVDGRIRVFDRETLEPLGTIAIGYGPRLPHFSQATGRLLASSARAHYAWERSGLAERFPDR